MMMMSRSLFLNKSLSASSSTAATTTKFLMRHNTSPTSYRFFSFFDDGGGDYNNNKSRRNNNNKHAYPTYKVYGETSALTINLIPPTFKHLGKQSIVLDSNKKGRLLLDFSPRKTGIESSRYDWDSSVKFAITAEEVGLLLGRLHTMEGIELSRQTASSSTTNNNNSGDDGLSKVLRVQEFHDGSALFSVDYYNQDGSGGQEPPTSREARGPIEVSLMVGEYQVIKSIFQYSMPRLVGWSTMMDMSMENALCYTPNQQQQQSNVKNPHNYTGRADGVPF